MLKSLIFLGSIFLTTKTFAQFCQIYTSTKNVVVKQNDEFYKALAGAQACPGEINAVHEILRSSLHNKKYLVANRGRNNPRMGSFSIFETYSTQNQLNDAGIFLGHFTQLSNQNGKHVIDLDQTPNQGKLMVELIAWDNVKGYYNFYELIGEGVSSRWYYRGDSKDILMDNRLIYLNNTPQKPPIGQTLRCSGCHISGGPILKEINFPHNDWWTKSRPLIFEHPLSGSFMQQVQSLDTAENFAVQVKTGIQKLENSPRYQMLKRSLGIQNQLRPLFCDLEINIESDTTPFDKTTHIQIPASSIGSPLVKTSSFMLQKGVYTGLLQKYKMQFPENKAIDADHAWLVPVKGFSDLVALTALRSSGVADDKTIFDIHFSAPMGSLMDKDRCALLKLVPNTTNWKAGFMQNLKNSNLPVAQAMYQRMTNSSYTPAFYQSKMAQWYQQTLKQLASGQSDIFFQQMLRNRAAVFQSEISKNPRGQILEPGFRVIFPQPSVRPDARKL
ncbi:MAG: hypothetical protein JNL11_20305 [Bdellovibrionaceae bacterium]|nr:hypothetical protein [Pseudobdellovibrionaceae bacterium]